MAVASLVGIRSLALAVLVDASIGRSSRLLVDASCGRSRHLRPHLRSGRTNQALHLLCLLLRCRLLCGCLELRRFFAPGLLELPLPRRLLEYFSGELRSHGRHRLCCGLCCLLCSLRCPPRFPSGALSRKALLTRDLVGHMLCLPLRIGMVGRRLYGGKLRLLLQLHALGSFGHAHLRLRLCNHPGGSIHRKARSHLRPGDHGCLFLQFSRLFGVSPLPMLLLGVDPHLEVSGGGHGLLQVGPLDGVHRQPCSLAGASYRHAGVRLMHPGHG